MEILVEIKNIYGNEQVYPACDKSRLFAEIAGTKTLTAATLKHVKLLGYEIKVKQKQVTLKIEE
jgi:hypothetical protein